MEQIKNIFRPLLVVIILTIGLHSLAISQHRGHGHNKVHYRRGHAHNRVIIRKSVYRPRVIVVNRPVWARHRQFNRRWVYFPKYNMYWDNWRNMYVYRNNMVWVMNATPPPVVVNVNIEEEKSYELKEDEDDVDDVYNNNSSHEKEYEAVK